MLRTCMRNKFTFQLNLTVMQCVSYSSSRTYRVFVGKHNLAENEPGSKAISPEKIIVHEKWNPIFVALG